MMEEVKMMERLKKINDFEIPESCKEKDMPKSKLGMQLPNEFSKKGISKADEEYKRRMEL